MNELSTEVPDLKSIDINTVPLNEISPSCKGLDDEK
jgi:hypothetical protein